MNKIIVALVFATTSISAIAGDSTFDLRDKNGHYADLFENFKTVQVVKGMNGEQIECSVRLTRATNLKKTRHRYPSEEKFRKNPLKACLSKGDARRYNQFLNYTT